MNRGCSKTVFIPIDAYILSLFNLHFLSFWFMCLLLYSVVVALHVLLCPVFISYPSCFHDSLLLLYWLFRGVLFPHWCTQLKIVLHITRTDQMPSLKMKPKSTVGHLREKNGVHVCQKSNMISKNSCSNVRISHQTAEFDSIIQNSENGKWCLLVITWKLLDKISWWCQ